MQWTRNLGCEKGFTLVLSDCVVRMENYTGVLRCGADELEYELGGIEQGSRVLTPEVARAIEGVRFIADHLKEEDEANNVSFITFSLSTTFLCDKKQRTQDKTSPSSVRNSLCSRRTNCSFLSVWGSLLIVLIL